LFLFFGIFFPINALPSWAQKLAFFTPLYHIVVVCRNLVVGRTNSDVTISATLVIIISLVFFLMPIALMKRRLIK